MRQTVAESDIIEHMARRKLKFENIFEEQA
jgi:hypothetical protein